MPPHCDSLDGPVVTAARRGLQQGDVSVVLPYVPANREQEVRQAFDLTVKARALGPEAREVADRWLYETVVRVHREEATGTRRRAHRSCHRRRAEHSRRGRLPGQVSAVTSSPSTASSCTATAWCRIAAPSSASQAGSTGTPASGRPAGRSAST